MSRALQTAAAFAAAFALRFGAGVAMPPGRNGVRGFDFFGYMADNLLQGRGLCWDFYYGLGTKYANRGPLYPLLLAGVRWGSGGRHPALEIAVQAAVGAAAIAVPALLARRWAGERAWLPALWIGALWPYSVVTDTGVVEHVLYAPFSLLALWLALAATDPARRRGALAAAAAGAAAGLATLSRLTFLLSVPFLALPALRRRAVARLALAGLGLAAVLAPWVLRNHAVTGHWVAGTDGGRALFIGNAPATFDLYPDQSIDRAEVALLDGLRERGDTIARLQALNPDEVAQDALWKELALREIAAAPGTVAWNGLRKAAALWSPVYNPGPAGALRLVVFAATFVPLVAAAAAAVVTCPRIRADLPAVLGLLASFTLGAALFWGQSRYLAPLHGIGIAAATAWMVRRPEPAA